MHGALAMRAASSPPVDELEERRPLTEAARSPFAAPPSTSAWQRARDQLRRALGAERTPGNALNQDLLASISAAVRGQVSATPGSLATSMKQCLHVCVFSAFPAGPPPGYDEIIIDDFFFEDFPS